MSKKAREAMFNSDNTPQAFKEIYPAMLKDKKPYIGKLRPLVWQTEPTKGCNLRCGHCATRLFKPGKLDHMSVETWVEFLHIAKEVAPMARLEMSQAGEPTLNPNLLEMLAKAKEICPTLQTMIYTNGITLLKEKLTYKQLFDAGLNMILIDVYGDIKPHEVLAEKSGYQWGYRYDCEDKPNVFNYYGGKQTDINYIALGPNPEDYDKVGRGAKMSTMMSTFLNNLDWKAAEKFGMTPVVKPPRRRCSQPSKMAVVAYDGSYTFCCFDFTREVTGSLGNVSEGIDGFYKYWLGEYMQDVRARLFHKDRESHPQCKKCNFCCARCDMPKWSEDLVSNYWDGAEWKKIDYIYTPPVDPQMKLF